MGVDTTSTSKSTGTDRLVRTIHGRPGIFFAYGTGPDNASYSTDPENEERILDHVRVVSVLRGAYMEAHRLMAVEMREY